MLEALGVDRSDEQIYLQLIRHGPTSVVALAAATGQGRRGARAAVDRLCDAGLAQLSPPPHEQAIAVPLEVGVDHLIRQRRHDLELVRHTAARLAAELTPSVDGQLTMLSGRAEVLHQVHHSAQREFRVLVRSASFLSPHLVTRGAITYRAVCDTSGPSFDDVFRGTLKTKFAHGVPVNLALADQARALVQLDHNVLLVRQGRLLDALSALFEAFWASATPAGSTQDAIDTLDRAVLSLLVAGLTDDAVGARLGMSRRTVARRVQRLMHATGAHSRLQLGWWARERNWLQ